MTFTICLFALLLDGAASSQETTMTTYQLVLLKKGPAAATGGTSDDRKIFKEHIAYMMKLNADGVSLAAGPVTDRGDIQGFIIMGVPTAEHAREISSSDPAAKAGIFTVEALSFMAPERWFGKWTEPFEQETVYFGFLNRGPNRSQDEATAARLQKEHLAYMDRQAKEGKLVLAGPFVNGGVHRGVVAYRVGTMEEAKERAEGDPMIKAGRLVVELHPWSVPKGALPARP
jgi:uncharacterized protein YciI